MVNLKDINMQHLKFLSDITKKDVSIAGGKGASLGEMYNAGFPIPPGFCITAEAYQKFLMKTGIANKIYSILTNLDVDNNDALQMASKNVQGIIMQTQPAMQPKTGMEKIAPGIVIIIASKMDAGNIILIVLLAMEIMGAWSASGNGILARMLIAGHGILLILQLA